MVWDVRRDSVELGDGQTVTRELIAHTGAVGVIALNAADEVLLLRQYRHPVSSYLWEPPAGLLDVAGRGRARLRTARAVRGGRPAGRRVARAARLLQLARRQHRGVPLLSGPRPARGAGGRASRARRARSATWPPPGSRSTRRATSCWPAGLHNPAAVSGILAAAAARTAGLGHPAPCRRAVAGALARTLNERERWAIRSHFPLRPEVDVHGAPKCLTPERWAGLPYELSDPAREGVAYAYSASFLRRTGRAVRHQTSDQPGGPRDQSVGTGLACVRGRMAGARDDPGHARCGVALTPVIRACSRFEAVRPRGAAVRSPSVRLPSYD